MKFKAEHEDEEPTEEDGQDMTTWGADAPPLMGLVGDLTETSSQNLAMALLAFNGGKILATQEDLEDDSDIEFFISSGGGSVNDMLAVYDLLTLVKNNRDIATFGYGKIYSAAVPLLAAGTKGKRYMSKHARLMIHHCSANTSGSHSEIKCGFEELQQLEEMMVKIIAHHSKLTPKKIYKLMSRNTDVYFSAEEALEMGIVDKII